MGDTRGDEVWQTGNCGQRRETSEWVTHPNPTAEQGHVTPLIDIFSVSVRLGCLHIQRARVPKDAKSSPDRLTRTPVGAHHAQHCPLETVRTGANPPVSATPRDPASPITLRPTKTVEAKQ